MKVSYSADGKTAVYCGYKFRKDPKTGYYLCSKKTDANKRERLHEYVWRSVNGEIPKGYHIHHIDKNKDNNEISNLQLLSIAEHMKTHAEMRTDKERQKLRDNLINNATPKAKAWHTSEAGREWHSNHAKEMLQNRQLREYQCTNCGCTFTTYHVYSDKANHFCGNNCRAAFRRRLGVDNVEKRCKKCGNTYIANKYQHTAYCECCRDSKHKKGWQS